MERIDMETAIPFCIHFCASSICTNIYYREREGKRSSEREREREAMAYRGIAGAIGGLYDIDGYFFISLFLPSFLFGSN